MNDVREEPFGYDESDYHPKKPTFYTADPDADYDDDETSEDSNEDGTDN